MSKLVPVPFVGSIVGKTDFKAGLFALSKATNISVFYMQHPTLKQPQVLWCATR